MGTSKPGIPNDYLVMSITSLRKGLEIRVRRLEPIRRQELDGLCCLGPSARGDSLCYTPMWYLAGEGRSASTFQ
jgi:hypothetical protein